MASQKNEGEGNKTAAREFNQAQERFVKEGQWKGAAEDAARAVDGPEGEELRRAEEASRKPAGKDKPVPPSDASSAPADSKRR